MLLSVHLRKEDPSNFRGISVINSTYLSLARYTVFAHTFLNRRFPKSESEENFFEKIDTYHGRLVATSPHYKPRTFYLSFKLPCIAKGLLIHVRG